MSHTCYLDTSLRKQLWIAAMKDAVLRVTRKLKRWPVSSRRRCLLPTI